VGTPWAKNSLERPPATGREAWTTTVVFNFDDGAELWTVPGQVAKTLNRLTVASAYEFIVKHGRRWHSSRSSRATPGLPG
jgi:hypothetical protein